MSRREESVCETVTPELLPVVEATARIERALAQAERERLQGLLDQIDSENGEEIENLAARLVPRDEALASNDERMVLRRGRVARSRSD